VPLDYPRWFSLQRLVRRTAARLLDRRVICNGNRESLRTTFSRDAIVLWHFQSFARKRERIRQWCADPVGPSTIRLPSSRQTAAWLAGIARRGYCPREVARVRTEGHVRDHNDPDCPANRRTPCPNTSARAKQ